MLTNLRMIVFKNLFLLPFFLFLFQTFLHLCLQCDVRHKVFFIYYYFRSQPSYPSIHLSSLSSIYIYQRFLVNLFSTVSTSISIYWVVINWVFLSIRLLIYLPLYLSVNSSTYYLSIHPSVFVCLQIAIKHEIYFLKWLLPIIRTFFSYLSAQFSFSLFMQHSESSAPFFSLSRLLFRALNKQCLFKILECA